MDVSYFKKFVRSFLGTPFRHQGRASPNREKEEKGSLDCLGFIMELAKELSLTSKDGITPLTSLDQVRYSLRPNGDKMMNIVREHLNEVALADIKIGDLMVFLIEGNPQHFAVYMGNGIIIHADGRKGKVVEEQLTEDMLENFHSAYHLKMGNGIKE